MFYNIFILFEWFKFLLQNLYLLLKALLKKLMIKQAYSVKEYFQKNSNSKSTGVKSTTRVQPNLQVR